MRNVLLFLGLSALVGTSYGYPGGAPMGYAGQPPSGNSCVNCHSSFPLNSGDGSLQINGLPAGGYQSGNTYNLSVTLADPGQVRWGFQLTAIYVSGGNYLQAGTLVVTDPTHTTLLTGSGSAPDYLNQTSSGTYNGTPGPTTWNFNWTAPNTSTGTLTFYASGAACNGTGGTSGDYVYTASAPLNPAGSTPNVTITLTPSNPPIQIPASGGSFNFTIAVANWEASPQASTIWCNITLPNGSTYGPVLGPLTITLPASFSTNRLRSQTVPASAPAGNYAYNGFIGANVSTVWDQDSFPFTKLTSDGGFAVGEWSNDGEELEVVSSVLENYALVAAFPNPFNPSTRVQLALSAAHQVELAVFDTQGRRVAELVNGRLEAGTYEMEFDGSRLPSGVYLYRLQADDFTASGKMVLMK
jgi:hypothetical protein